MTPTNSKFFIGKNESVILYPGYGLTDSGEPVAERESYTSYPILTQGEYIYINFTSTDNYNAIFFYDKDEVCILRIPLMDVPNAVIKLPEGALYWALRFTSEDEAFALHRNLDIFYYLTPVEPHYSSLTKKVAKESSEQFFRDSLESKLTIYGKDYEVVKNASINDKMLLLIYDRDNLWFRGSFTKADCKMNHDKMSCEVKPTALDAYTEIMNKYEDTYDLIKCKTALAKVRAHKRMLTQVYVQGANVISNYIGGTYWESDVNESIDKSRNLINKYHFSYLGAANEFRVVGAKFEDVNGVYAGKNGTYTQDRGKYVARLVQHPSSPTLYELFIFRASDNKHVYVSTNPSSMILNDPNNKYIPDVDKMTFRYLGATSEAFNMVVKNQITIPGSHIENIGGTYLRNKGSLYWVGDGYHIVASQDWATTMYDIAIIRDADGEMVYKSTSQYAVNPEEEEIDLGAVEMSYVASSDLSAEAVDCFVYHCFVRTLCETSEPISFGGIEYVPKDVPLDDFVSDNRNYKKCLPIYTGTFECISAKSDEPTKYGIDDFGKYFTNRFFPSTSGYGRPLPICHSTWANAGLWYIYDNNAYTKVDKALRYEYTLRDCYHISSVISALLKKIDPTIKHEPTKEYSQFLYGPRMLGMDRKFYVYLTQKSNVLKGNYDQAAQKAETTFKSIMEMLKNCFRLYWYIDNGKFKIEHISYFMNGYSYSGEGKAQIDFTKIKDSFNRRNKLFFQNSIEYDKSELYSRYEFGWMDDCTEVFDGLSVDIKANYTQQDQTEEVSANDFTSDMDYMLADPNNFSSDGFALLCPVIEEDGVLSLPIVESTLRDEDGFTYNISAQNFYASWPYLFRFYLYDLPAKNAYSDTLGDIVAQGIKRCMTHSVEVVMESDIEPTEGAIKTDMGIGYIDSYSVTLPSRMTKVKLLYSPE